MLRHEYFEEICAAASIGQATPEELSELEHHTAQCEACRRAYHHYLDFAARNFADTDLTLSLSSQEAEQCLNSELFTRRFYGRAEREGIVFSGDVEKKTLGNFTPLPAFRRRFTWIRPAWAVAAIVVVGLIIAAGDVFRRLPTHRTAGPLPELTQTDRLPEERLQNDSVPNVPAAKVEPSVIQLIAASLKLQTEIGRVSAELDQANGRLSATEKELNATINDRQKLEADRAVLTTQLNDAQRQVVESQKLVESAKQEAARLSERSSETEATLVAAQTKIQELTQGLKEMTTSWDEDRQLLSLSRDVTDLMATRNLHIVDVVDTDPRGKTRPSFGRIFFTEGKSLVFYAYDLNEAKIEKANYEYRIWARKEGADGQVRSLGIFYSDNKEQRRWVFKCDDPKILNEIDSVFVTLEPSNSKPAQPKGPGLMYAYLRGQPNHPG